MSSDEARGGSEEVETSVADAEAVGRQRRRRPLFRRILQYIRSAWTGVKFALDSDFEDMGEQMPRYRPDSIESLMRVTQFSRSELKKLYRGFKSECPTGVVREDTFKQIYSQFFPQGANTSQYSHFVFRTFDQDHTGFLSFEDFVIGLSLLSRGTAEEKLRWTFRLYDINGDGYISKEEMTEIVSSVYDLMGRVVDPVADEKAIRDKVESMFEKMDLNRDGVLTREEFVEGCLHDQDIMRSISVFDSNI